MPPLGPSLPNSTAKILVIDDDPAVQMLLRRVLQSQGYEVSLASNGDEGLKLAQEVQPALIICDWMMPGSDGLEVCRQVKAIPELSTCFFVLLTSRSSIEDRVMGLDTGADDFLTKPIIEVVELQAKVRAGLRVYQLAKALQAQTQILELELAEASAYVRSLLPVPVEHPLLIDSRFIPSQALGGDCFDYFWLDQNRLVLFLLDMSGHGLGAALPSVSVLNLLRSQSLNEVDFGQPEQVLTALNRVFQMGEHGDKYFTIWYGVFHAKERSLCYASAGHPPALLLSREGSDWQVHPLKTKGFPIGMFAKAQYQSSVQPIQPSSSLYIFSDGVYEILQADGQLWGLSGLTELLVQLHRLNRSHLNVILENLQQLYNDEPFKDDISIVQANF
ncbi:MAG: SpoIIE family protein phosphatase [Prochlorothrix sp.]|nr:SpoIIE family protein phosphatase [Prochlorothrix sp.]